MPGSKAIVFTFGFLAMACAGGTGCGLQPGHSVMTQNRNSDPVLATAPDSGEYALYTATSPNAMATVKVNRGDPLGFRRADDGHLVAVAGDQNFDLPAHAAQAYWKFEKAK
jgi:hypothetical protein